MQSQKQYMDIMRQYGIVPIDRRKEKRHERKDYVAIACLEGELAAEMKLELGRLRKNPYPPGRRHDAWQREYERFDNCADDWRARRE